MTLTTAGNIGVFLLFGTKAQNQVPLLHLKVTHFFSLWPQILFLLHEERLLGLGCFSLLDHLLALHVMKLLRIMPVSLTLKTPQRATFWEVPLPVGSAGFWIPTQACNLRNSPCAQAWNFEETVLFFNFVTGFQRLLGRHTSSLFLWCEWTNHRVVWLWAEVNLCHTSDWAELQQVIRIVT